MFLSGTFTKAVMYIMLLCDSIIAGHFIGESGVAAINAITPVTGIVTFFGDLVSTGVGIVYTRTYNKHFHRTDFRNYDSPDPEYLLQCKRNHRRDSGTVS